MSLVHNRRRVVRLALAFTAVTAAVAAYLLWPRPNLILQTAPDLTAALAANARGVGRMERFEYPEAAAEFAEAARLAPEWRPARINFGIARFNQDTPEALAEARVVFAQALALDPDDRHAHFCLGVISAERGPFADAHPHFAAVNRLDPGDAHTLLRLGLTHPAGPRSAEARGYFEQALARNPYLNAARYNLSQILYDADPDRAKRLEAEFKALVAANWESESAAVYGVMGKYADVIGRDPKAAPPQPVGPLPPFVAEPRLRVTLAPGARWATPADLDPVRRAARARFGGAVVLCDFDRDGRPDVFLVAAAVENGIVRDLLLRNGGDMAFTDVTAAAGLASTAPALGAAAGDYDNDGRPDLVVTGAAGVRLYHNKGDGTFENVSAAARLDGVSGVFLGCGWADLDQDGDLDLVVCKYAESAAAAGAFDSPDAGGGGGVLVFENVGEAPPAKPNAPQPGLTTRFRRDADRVQDAAATGRYTTLLTSDLDDDRDLDLLLLADHAPPAVVENDRLMRFRRTSPGWATGSTGRWNGGLVLDANHDECSDLFLIPAADPPVFLLSTGGRDYVPGRTNSPPLKQATTTDIDLDGWADVVGLTATGKPILLHNTGDGRLEATPDAFGTPDEFPTAITALTCADLDEDGAPDLILWSDAGLHLRRNSGNGNRSISVVPTGRRDTGSNQRTNADGIGAWVVAQAGPHWAGAERVTAAAGLGQSLMPTVLGLGKAGHADAVRVRWPDAVIQAELGVKAGPFRVTETNRKGTSCPILMAWDGEKFAFVTDFLGAGALGERGPDGTTRPPRPEESVKIEPGQLRPQDGQYVIKISEPMDEVLYLDRVRLDLIDHPAGTSVFPDERFVTAGPPPTQELLAFGTRFFPKSATDHRGRDVLKVVSHRDRRAVDGFAPRSWLGYAEAHSLTLDFGPLPATGGRWFLVLAGWTEYPYPESIYAATRAGINLDSPVLERLGADGTWQFVCDLGFPAGLPRVMTRELPKFRPDGPCVLRVRTNMQVYWDQIHLAPAETFATSATSHSLEPSGARLAVRGFAREVLPAGRPPVAYDDGQTEHVAVTNWKGKLTRLGDVTELISVADDRFVLCGPGHEITVRFAAANLAPVARGMERSFVLRTWGYCKDTAPTTATGGEVDPLPSRRMSSYPPSETGLR